MENKCEDEKRQSVKTNDLALKWEEEWRRDYQRAVSLKNTLKNKGADDEALFARLEHLAQELKSKIRLASETVLRNINLEYGGDYALAETIEGKEGFYYQNGILSTLKETGLFNKLFQQMLVEFLPTHPKEEFTQTRMMKRKFFVHAGPTNSGKTFESIAALRAARTGVYLSPLRLLALEIFEKMNVEGTPCDLATGEEEIEVPFARHRSSTIEKARFEQTYDIAVIDEGQMLGDPQRGAAWTRAVLGVRAPEVHICCALNAVALIQTLVADCGDEFHLVRHERAVPLLFEEEKFSFPHSVQKGDALIVFSRKAALQVASHLAQNRIMPSIIYGNLPPETRRKQVDLFLNGATDVVVATDAIGMGLNLPIQRVVFLESEKFDGSEKRMLTTQEVKQIAGRAGRKGMYDKGFVNVIKNKEEIKNKYFDADRPLATAYIAPMENTILALPAGALRERLDAWMKYKIDLGHYAKVDISEQLSLLDQSEQYEEKIGIGKLYKAINIPFNQHDETLIDLWFLYLDHLVQKKAALAKPQRRGYELSDLESYYRSIDLYYSFSKTYALLPDLAWIKSQREETSELIHQSLLKDLKKHMRKCSLCKRELRWNHFESICDNCKNDKKQTWNFY